MPAQRVGRATGAAAPVGARQDEQADRTQRGHHRLPIRQDRLKKAQAPYCRRHNGTAAGRGGAFSRHSGSVGAKALLIRLFMYFWCLKISQLGKQYKDYEISVASAEAFVKIACIRHMQASGMALRTVFKRQTSHCGSYPRLAPRRGIES